MTRGTRRFHVLLIAGAVLVAGPTVTTLQTDPGQLERDDAADRALRPHGIGRDQLRSEVVAIWNRLAHDLALAEDQFLTFKGQRALAMMHLAMHDALNAIVPIYEPYVYSGAEPRIAHPVAAAAQSAHDVLLSQYPGQSGALAEQLGRTLSEIPNSTLRSRGIDLGRAAAAAVLAARADDDWDLPGTYEFKPGPGRYQTTPPWNGFVAQPGFRFAQPFALEYPHQFRPPPPPPLQSAAYARALREVQEYGATDSTRRTEDQTAYAVWWMEFAEGSVNRLARQLVDDRDVPLWTAARLFAHIGVSLYDTYVATWDSKYVYDHWRPYTSIRAADTDENPRTTADPAWEPLRPTPPFPEYVSAHAAACGASFGVLEHTFGRRVSFTMQTTTAPPGMPTRTFRNFRSAAAECADSRVRLGFHYRYATDSGLALGKRIARYSLGHSLRRARSERGSDR
jgi:PAP2 superfamily